MSEKEILKRCGFCGNWFIGNEFCYEEQLKSFTKEELDSAPLGYCPNAQNEDMAQNPENYHNVITKDMAMDAGDLSLEGQIL